MQNNNANIEEYKIKKRKYLTKKFQYKHVFRIYIFLPNRFNDLIFFSELIPNCYLIFTEK